MIHEKSYGIVFFQFSNLEKERSILMYKLSTQDVIIIK